MNNKQVGGIFSFLKKEKTSKAEAENSGTVFFENDLFVNHNRFLKAKDFETAQAFLYKIFGEEYFKGIAKAPVWLSADEKDKFYNGNIFIKKKSAKNCGSEELIHEYIHYLEACRFPFVKSYTDIFLAKVISVIFYLHRQNFCFHEDFNFELSQQFSNGQIFYNKCEAEKKSGGLSRILADKIDELIQQREVTDSYDLQEPALFAVGFLREMYGTTGSLAELFEIIRFLGTYDYKFVRNFQNQ